MSLLVINKNFTYLCEFEEICKRLRELKEIHKRFREFEEIKIARLVTEQQGRKI